MRMIVEPPVGVFIKRHNALDVFRMVRVGHEVNTLLERVSPATARQTALDLSK
jgi:hypothetical protein